MTFPYDSEAERKRLLEIRPHLRRQAPDLSTDFLLAWIHKESRGLVNARSVLDERGLFQIGVAERESLGLPDEDWQKLLSPSQGDEYAVRIGLIMVRGKVRRARGYMAAVGASGWSRRDFYALVKLCHGAPAIAKQMLLIFKARNGRPPESWQEAKTSIPYLENERHRKLAPRVIKNAEDTVRYLENLLDSVLSAILFGRFA